MRQKLINLCLNSFELAAKKENFSHWVRQKLLEESDIPKPEHLFKCRACNYERVYPTPAIRHCPTCGFRLSLIPIIQTKLPGEYLE